MIRFPSATFFLSSSRSFLLLFFTSLPFLSIVKLPGARADLSRSAPPPALPTSECSSSSIDPDSGARLLEPPGDAHRVFPDLRLAFARPVQLQLRLDHQFQTVIFLAHHAARHHRRVGSERERGRPAPGSHGTAEK